MCFVDGLNFQRLTLSLSLNRFPPYVLLHVSKARAHVLRILFVGDMGSITWQEVRQQALIRDNNTVCRLCTFRLVAF
jgi:hypothetical protein